MAQSGKLEREIELESPADKVFKVFSSTAHHIPNICPESVHEINVHEGDWETPGSVKKWSYSVSGVAESVKETIEEIDEENKSITFKILEGEVLNDYKSFKSKLKLVATDKGSLAKWTLEYEKVNEEVPEPTKYLDLAFNITKSIDSHLIKPPAA